MTKKFVYLFAAVAMMATSCQDSASSKIKDVSTETDVVVLDDAASTPEQMPAATEVVEKVSTEGKPVMTFDNNIHDFGNLKAGANADYSFKFKNTGEADLLITNAQGSCGCTVPEYPKEPIKPGETGQIKVSYSSGSQQGQQSKTVTLTTNSASGEERLVIKANVEPKPAG